MKIQAGSEPIIIGKRVTIGAAILSLSETLQQFFPEHAGALGASAIFVTFVVQILIARYYGVTNNAPTET